MLNMLFSFFFLWSRSRKRDPKSSLIWYTTAKKCKCRALSYWNSSITYICQTCPVEVRLPWNFSSNDVNANREIWQDCCGTKVKSKHRCEIWHLPLNKKMKQKDKKTTGSGAALLNVTQQQSERGLGCSFLEEFLLYVIVTGHVM